MNYLTLRHFPRTIVRVLTVLLTCVCGSGLLLAQTGTIQGRVYNPASKEYIGNAEVRIDGTNQVTYTEADGSFRFVNVPAGSATLSVGFTGYTTAKETLNIGAGETAVREISLTSSAAAPKMAGEVLQLSAFTVSSEREGNSKAIMSQKRNMNVTTSVASDIFGDVTDGNVGEFLKFLPGVDIDYVESETRGPRLGGMDAQYTGVSFDGTKVASADALRTGDLGRATSFEAFSISSIESIEINRTTSPDMDADSPAGTINMKTRRAFDRKGRRTAYNFSYNLNSEEFTWRKTYGPGGNREYKARPNYSLEYSDVFMKQRLGLVASISHVDSYTEQYRHNMTYNRTATTADPRSMVLTTLNFKDGNKNIAKDTYTLTADFKASSRLVLSNTIIYNYALGQFYNREMNFVAATNDANANTGRSMVLGDGLNTVMSNGLAANTARAQTFGGGNASKRTITFTMIPKFEYKAGSWTVDGTAAYTRSYNNYEGLEKGHTRDSSTNGITGDFIATRPAMNSYEWTIQQTSGPDWFNLANRANPRISNEGRYAFTENYNGQLNAKWIAPFRLFPTAIKFGGKWNEEARKNGNETSYNTWSYIGPGGNVLNPATGAITTTGTWAAYPNQNFWSTGTTNILTVKDSTGAVRPQSIPRVDDNAVGALFNAHPEYFVNIATADNYYNAFIAPRRDIKETVTAGYGMADIRVSDRIQVRTGLRYEQTEDTFTEFNPRTKAEMLASGYALNTSARATTITGYAYQFQSKPRITRTNKYHDYFPMISVKYAIMQDLQFHVGANRAIARPPADSLTGAWIINEDTQVVTSPNPNLLPEYSKNYVARLGYYFEPAGQLSVTVSQNDIRNLRATRIGTAAEFGIDDDPVYSSYQFNAPFNVASPVRFRNMELAYNQSLSFLPEMLRGTTINLAYTRSYASVRRTQLLPHRFTSSLGYRYKRFSTRLGIVWRADTPGMGTDGTYGLYRRHDTKYDLGGEFRLTSYATLFFQGRNIFNDGQLWMRSAPGAVEGQAAAAQTYENYGANWNFGIKGTF